MSSISYALMSQRMPQMVVILMIIGYIANLMEFHQH